jgi:uncharacterized YigZ family protein
MSSITDDHFLTVEPGLHSSEIKIKGSRFIAHVIYVPGREKAEAEYESIKKNFYDATHNCFAYRITKDMFRYSDDGEPSGTAGRPMLQVIEGRDLLQVLVVVTRYFGGTKLGTGGLIRAYSEATRTVLDQTRIVKKIIYRHIKLHTGYEHLREVNDLISRHEGKIDKVDYADQVVVYCRIPAGRVSLFQSEMIYKVDITEV